MKKRVNLYLNSHAVETAKKQGINISKLAEFAIRQELRKKVMNSNEIDTEFEHIANILIKQGDLSVLLDCIPYLTKKEVIESWSEKQ